VRLRDAVVVVTGASAGIGRATALRFAREGSTVVLAARRLERLEALAEQIAAHGGNALAVRCDVSVAEDLDALRARVEEIHGRCDVLVNNAGVPQGGSFQRLSAQEIERIVRINLLGVVLGTHAFLPMLLAQRRGHVVNVASLAGRFAVPGAAVYSATKHGVVAFSESLHYELKPKGILVTTVNPGFTRTEGFPMTGTPTPLVMTADRVARVLVDVVRRDRAPEVSIPRTYSAAQVFRVLTPPLYRWGLERGARAAFRNRPSKESERNEEMPQR
jgi:short-subunit dehydrogenase